MFWNNDIKERLENLETCIKPVKMFSLFGVEYPYRSDEIQKVNYRIDRLMHYLGIEEVTVKEKREIVKFKKEKK